MRNLRLAICQLECHPALYTGHISCQEEPFVPTVGAPSLSSLSTSGVQVDNLQALCLHKYNDWALSRLQQLLEELEKLEPTPDILLFPEGAIPISGLESLKMFSDSPACSIFAGTHSPQRSAQATQEYRKIGVRSDRINKLIGRGVRNILPIFSNSKVRIVEKQLHSPIEHSIISTRSITNSPILKPQVIISPSGNVRVLPMICAEALQQPRLPSEYELVVILSFDARHEQFIPFIEHQVKNRKFVAYCNDGHVGGSMIFGADDKRSPNWMRDALPNGMPPGDSLMVVHIDLDVTAVEVDTASPNHAIQLVALKSIVSEHSEHVESARQLEEIRVLGSSDARALELAQILRSPSLTNLQRVRFNYLYEQDRRGLSSTSLWESLGADCVMAGIPPLIDLERTLAASCVEQLLAGALGSASQSPATSQELLTFVSRCQSKAGGAKPTAAIDQRREKTSIIDRERETQNICSFLESGGPHLLEITGLPQIGKTEILLRSLEQSGKRATKLVELSETSSADFILLEILRLAGVAPSPPYLNPIELAKSETVIRALRRWKCCVLADATCCWIMAFGAMRHFVTRCWD